ncbi:hypothetical protein GCM10027290_66180 [Micromonospora sonneratiae]
MSAGVSSRARVGAGVEDTAGVKDTAGVEDTAGTGTGTGGSAGVLIFVFGGAAPVGCGAVGSS